MSKKHKNPIATGNPGMGDWWRRMREKVKQSGKIYVKAHRRKNKIG